MTPAVRRTRQILVVGAGFAGSVTAREFADAGHRVLVIDRRSHIGGNAFDEPDPHGVLVHHYGPHIFHTWSERIFRYLSRFTAWRPYKHRVLASVNGLLVPVPVNLTTINQLYGLDLDETGARAFLEMVREKRTPVRTSEDVVLNSVGRDLCDKIFRGYTFKHWGLDLSELDDSVAARIPTRVNKDDRYFTDTFQAMPAAGYTRMFENMLDHRLISIELGIDFNKFFKQEAFAHIFYTGPIDEYFGRRYGRLPYRSLRFHHEHLPHCTQFQPVATINYPNEHEFTRVTEFKHLTGQVHAGTSIVREYPQSEGEPYYPVPRPENKALFKRYRTLAQTEHGVTFVGRLAQYQYFNMDQVVGAALAAASKVLKRMNA